MKPKILIFAPYFLPGVKGGGPIVSTKNIIDHLKPFFDFYVITSDRDLGDTEPYPDIIKNKWIFKETGLHIWYSNENDLSFRSEKQIINELDPDYIYINSFFSYKFSILPVLLRKLRQIKVKEIVLAPRGEFSPGAFKLKERKKKLFVSLSRFVGLHSSIKWHATSFSEKELIEGLFSKNSSIKIANNLTKNYEDLEFTKTIEKKSGNARFIFISRIHPKKNLLEAINMLEDIKGNVVYDIYGPIEDKKYWIKCEDKIKTLPKNITIRYKGILSHLDIHKTLLQYHYFLFPTLGENYGHVISEALIGGCPVIISDQTPWRDLEQKQAGWDIGLANKEKFKHVLHSCVIETQEDYMEHSEKAFNYGIKQSRSEEDKIATKALFS